VRKDFAYFGQFGHPGIGYRVDELIVQVRKILAQTRHGMCCWVERETWPGADGLQRILTPRDFGWWRCLMSTGQGPASDRDQFSPPPPTGKESAEEIAARQKRTFLIQPLSELKETVEKAFDPAGDHRGAGRPCAGCGGQNSGSGCARDLNFAPVSLNLPADVGDDAVDLAVQLEQLSFQVMGGRERCEVCEV